MKKTIYILISLIFLSCGIVDFSPSDSIKVNPSKYNQVMDEGEDIYVEYGFSPDHVSAQSAFEVQDADGRVGGSFNWNGNKMFFTPQKCFEPSRRYLLKYAGEVSDKSGAVHKYNIYTPFFYMTTQSVKPAVSRMSPADGSTVQPYEKVIFSFSTPMSLPSFLRGFSISPDVECTDEWNEDHTQMVLTPKEGWKEHQVYTFSFSEANTFCVFCSTGAAPPSVLSVDTALNDGLSYPVLLSGLDGVKSRDAIRIEFSSQMDFEAAEDALSIRPDVAGHTCWLDDRTLVFIPDAEWQGETLYSISIDATAKSRKGLSIPERFEASFTPDVIPLKLLGIEGKAADGFPLSAFNPHQEIEIDVGDALLPENTYTFSFVFNHGFETAEKKEQIYSGIKLKGVFPPSIASPKVASFFWSGDSRVQIAYTGFEPEGRIYSLDVNGLEKITLRTR